MIFLAIFPLTFAHFAKPLGAQRFRLRSSDIVERTLVESSPHEIFLLHSFLVPNKRYTVLDFRNEPCYD